MTNDVFDTEGVVTQYTAVLDVLDKAHLWDRQWAQRQHVGLVVTAMCYAVVEDENEARRFAVLRVLEVLLEHQADLLPATEADFVRPRSRVAALAVAERAHECAPWIDVLEYLQLRNWTRKGVYSDPNREGFLREQIEGSFGEKAFELIQANREAWWLT